MSTGSDDIRFEPLPVKRRALAGADASQYSVRSASGESREIKAETAYEALIKSGLKDAIKIERMSSLGRAVIEKSGLAQEQLAPETQKSLHDSILQRRSPIISADELDELIRSLRKVPEAVPQAPIADVIAAPLVPEPAEIPQQEGATSAIGRDVQGDGFDEIIPAAPPVKPVIPKPQEAAGTPKPVAPTQEMSPSGADLPSEQQLSPEEVEKLLGGK